MGIFQPHGALARLQTALLFPALLTACLPVPTAARTRLPHATAPLLRSSGSRLQQAPGGDTAERVLPKPCKAVSLGGPLQCWGGKEATSCQGKAAFLSCSHRKWFFEEIVGRRSFFLTRGRSNAFAKAALYRAAPLEMQPEVVDAPRRFPPAQPEAGKVRSCFEYTVGSHMPRHCHMKRHCSSLF